MDAEKKRHRYKQPGYTFSENQNPEKDLHGAMQYNLNGYWKSKLNQKLIFFTDYWVEFSVLTLCRIAYTLQHKQIVSKCEAAKKILEILPYRNVISEALRIRERTKAKPLFKSIFSRQAAVKDFISHVIAGYGNQKSFEP